LGKFRRIENQESDDAIGAGSGIRETGSPRMAFSARAAHWAEEDLKTGAF